MKVSHRNDDDRLAVDSVDHTIGESGDEATSYPRRNLGIRLRKTMDAPHCSIELIEKFSAQTVSLLVIPSHRIVQLSLSECEKSHFHERRCFASAVS